MNWLVMKERLEKAMTNQDSHFKGYSLLEALSLLVRERFITRAAQSEVGDAFIFKGGLLLTMMYTKGSRYTNDADVTIIGPNDLQTLQKTIDTIMGIELEDGFKFTRNTGHIISNDMREYDGAQFQITCEIEGYQPQKFNLDIGIGDAVKPILSKLPTLEELSATALEVQVYPPETIAAEKLHACIYHGADNTRMKDYYDLYQLREIVDIKKFNAAARATFKRRKEEYPCALPEDEIKNSQLQTRWDSFLKSQKSRVFREMPKDIASVMKSIREFYGTVKP